MCTGLVLQDCIDNEPVSPFGWHGPVPHEKHLIKLEPEKKPIKISSKIFQGGGGGGGIKKNRKGV